MKSAVSINLSSQPFRRDRPILIAAIAASAVLAGLLAFQVSVAWIQRGDAADARAAVERTRKQLQTISAEQAKLEATLRLPENAEALNYSLFLNELLLRKGISWTRIFSDLEAVMPHNVRLVAVRPQVDLTNQIRLDMTVASQTTEPVVNLLMKLESSPRFGATSVTTWLPPSQAEPLFRYRVNVNYAPQI
ncbi:MAG: hypothetical protein FJW20_14690 [Acidimicrobiia bacterium]|nr:hypothetical protein [Acidimicrobiia bacterium]